MKRVWIALLLCAGMLCGCQKQEQPQQPAQEPEKQTTEQVPPVESDETAAGEELAAACQAAYRTMAADSTFIISIQGADGAASTLDIAPEFAASELVAGPLPVAKYEWTPAEAEDWDAQTEEQGYLVIAADGDSRTTIQCRTGGDIVCWRQGGEAMRYARVVNPLEDQKFGEGKFARELVSIAEYLVEQEAWESTVSQTFAPAGKMAEAIAAYYRDIPDWVSWKPLDMKVNSVELYDTYEGTPEQLCCNMLFRIKVQDPAAPSASHWQLGDGLRDQDTQGYHLWSATLRMEKNSSGVWRVAERNSGVFVELPFDLAEASLEQLVDVFFRTGGQTHDWRVPSAILALPEKELKALPEFLEERGEMEVKLLCGALGSCLKKGGDWAWTLETLQPVMGAYDVYLDA